MDHLQNVRALEALIEAYHGREGTFNFHYSGFMLTTWDTGLRCSMKKEDYERMSTDDYAVTITYNDNSMSYDSYTVLLKDVVAWGETHGC